MAQAKEAVKLKKGEAVKFNSRNIQGWKGKGEFVRYEESGRGMWLIVKSETHGREVALRESQVKPNSVSAPAPKASKAKAEAPAVASS